MNGSPIFKIIIVFTICRISCHMLQQMIEQQTYTLENKSVSPTEHNRLERKIHTAKVFFKLLDYGCAVYVILECIRLFLLTFFF